MSAAVTPIPDAGSVDFVDVTDPAHEHVLATAPVTTDGVAIDAGPVHHPRRARRRRALRRHAGFAASESTTGGVTVARYVVAPGEARLGAYAFNDAITAALRDPDTGVTYVGGDFTELGLRTGPVAEVEPPGAGTGARIDGSPDVVGRITGATPDDDGYLLFGDLVAVNGAAVPLINGSATPIVRIGADNELDTGWNVTAKSLACAQYGGETQADLADLETMGNYVIVPFPRIRVDTSLNRTSTGLGLLDRASGVIYLTGQGTGLAPDGSACSRLWASIPPLPQVSGCTAQQCFADITTVTRDTTTGRPARDVRVPPPALRRRRLALARAGGLQHAQRHAPLGARDPGAGPGQRPGLGDELLAPARRVPPDRRVPDRDHPGGVGHRPPTRC